MLSSSHASYSSIFRLFAVLLFKKSATSFEVFLEIEMNSYLRMQEAVGGIGCFHYTTSYQLMELQGRSQNVVKPLMQ